MFFDDDDDDRFLNPEILHVVHRELYAITSNLEIARYGLRSVPTHTEDGIPIRKLYVSNLPPKTTRTELFNVFVQYGFIKSCWLRMGDKGPNRTPTPTYAFVTYSNPADAHKALLAPNHEKTLRGRNLKISPADSWHQPVEDEDNKIRWKPRGQKRGDGNSSPGSNSADPSCSSAPSAECSTDIGEATTSEATTSEATTLEATTSEATTSEATTSEATTSEATTSEATTSEATTSEATTSEATTSEATTSEAATSEATTSEANTSNVEEEPVDSEPSYNILDILNRDCMTHVLTFIPIKDLIRSERVSKTWQNMVLEYLQSIRTFKTSWWQHETTLTTAVLRHVLQRLGPSLSRLHIDHHLSALNDRTAHTIGKFCPNLDELKVVGMYTKNWNPLLYGCKQLKMLSFVSCNKLTDSSLVHLVKHDSCIENLTVANNTHVTGLFLTGSNTLKLHSLSFYNCYNLQGTVLCAAIDTLPNLTTLKLDVCPVTMWKIVPLILKKIPKLEELSLSEFMSVEVCVSPQGNEAFCEALATLTELKTLNLSRNININNAVMKQLAQSCTKLESLNVASCNALRALPPLDADTPPGVGDEGIRAVCGSCSSLRRLDLSYLGGLTDAGLRACARLPRLRALTARGVCTLSAAPLAHCLRACHQLQEIDACGCDNVSEEVITAAVEALNERPRPLILRLGGTSAALQEVLNLEDSNSENQPEENAAPQRVEQIYEYPTHKLLTVNLHEDRSNPNLRPDFVDRVFDYSSDDSLDDLYDNELYEVQDFDDFLGAEDELILDHDDDNIDRLYAFGQIHGADIILL